MKRKLPGVVELAVLVALACICAAVMAALGSTKALPLVAFPLLLAAMLMGAARNGKLSPAAQPVAVVDEVEEIEQAA